MTEKIFSDLINEDNIESFKDAITRTDYFGFYQDYMLVHVLIKTHKPKSVFEIGTNMGEGTNIICNATKDENGIAEVYSLDLPLEQSGLSAQHPRNEGKGDQVGVKCKFPYVQLFGDSMTFNYDDFPCEAYFVDGEHTLEHVSHETRQVLRQKPNLIIWHDSDIQGVWEGILLNLDGREDYELVRVKDTRIAYAVKK